jgi:hypothetical protein
MPFKKEDKNINREGRPKGNSYSVKLREQITEYCEENMTYFLQEIKSMKNGHAKVQAFISILNYALPKLTEANSKTEFKVPETKQVFKIGNTEIEF